MKPVSICVPVLRRYDLLHELLLSLRASTVMPATVYIIDNGMSPTKLFRAMSGSFPFQIVVAPNLDKPRGVAESWNWFIAHVPEERVIVNDDILFAPDSLSKLLASPAELVWATGQGFSCFVIRDRCVEQVGLFDEEISPGYGYYEDEDYLQRLNGRETRPSLATNANVDSGVSHARSSTLGAATPDELAEHHRRFLIAQGNYKRKWSLTSL